MVDQVCRSGAGVDVIEGVAGSGKTAALAVANNAWMTSGLTVRGCALAARAAAGLQAASGMLSTTVDGFLRRIERGDVVLGPNDVVVVDEAGMVGTRKLARVLDHADRARAKVVLIGDPRQLPEIDAGGAFAALTRSVGHVALATNRRQLERWERRALAGVRVGRDDALRAYERRGRIHECDDAQRAMVSSWVTVRESQGSGVMIAARAADVEALNRLARVELQSRGWLAADEVSLGGRDFATGDEVIALRNAYDIGVLNGTRLRITEADVPREWLRCSADDGRVVDLPFAYVVEGNLAHGYAVTIHKAQGMTVDRAFVLTDDAMANEHLYTALSRATIRTDLFVDTFQDAVQEAHAPSPASSARERLRNIGRRSARQSLAIEQDLPKGRGRSL